MSRVICSLLAVALSAGALAAQVAGPADAVGAIARIREEGLQRSQAVDTLFWLTDRYGPRLNGSPEFEEAGEWVLRRLTSWGLSAPRKERFPSAPGWSLTAFHATMTEPRVMPLIGMPRAWSAPTAGVVTAEVVRPVIATAADARAYRGTLGGKIVLTQPERPVRMLEHGDGTVLRYGDQNGRWRTEAMTPPAPRPAPGPAAGPAVPPSSAIPPEAAEPPFNLAGFYRDEGVLALFDRGPSGDLSTGGSGLSWRTQRVDGGTILVEDAAAPAAVPQVTLAVEHYNRIARLVDRGVPVRVELLVGASVGVADGATSFNILAEIPGGDLAGEIVLIGAHLDSWHGATGATDNAAGVAAAMEALRIIRAAGLQPRRTIRLGLWGGEEAGLAGSRAYVRAHVGGPGAAQPEADRTVVYFNLDNGGGRIRGIWTQGNTAAQRLFQAWSAPLADLGVDIVSPRSVGQTDHVPFEEAGVPAFQFVQERYQYNSRTHHTTMDVYDRVQPEDLRLMAVVAAAFVWQAASSTEAVPRALPAGGPER